MTIYGLKPILFACKVFTHFLVTTVMGLSERHGEIFSGPKFWAKLPTPIIASVGHLGKLTRKFAKRSILIIPYVIVCVVLEGHRICLSMLLDPSIERQIQ